MIKIICNVVSKFKYFTCTGHGISQEYYGRDLESLAGTGQGNMLPGAFCGDQSCLVFKKLEQMKKGVELILPMMSKRIRRTMIACADDTNFFANREKFIEKIKEIIDLCVRLHEATEAKTQEEKVKFYCWRCEMERGVRVTKQIEVETCMHQKKIE